MMRRSSGLKIGNKEKGMGISLILGLLMIGLVSLMLSVLMDILIALNLLRLLIYN